MYIYERDDLVHVEVDGYLYVAELQSGANTVNHRYYVTLVFPDGTKSTNIDTLKKFFKDFGLPEPPGGESWSRHGKILLEYALDNGIPGNAIELKANKEDIFIPPADTPKPCKSGFTNDK